MQNANKITEELSFITCNNFLTKSFFIISVFHYKLDDFCFLYFASVLPKEVQS